MVSSEALQWLGLGGLEVLLKPVSQVRILPGHWLGVVVSRAGCGSAGRGQMGGS
jgi:hypothetical protein